MNFRKTSKRIAALLLSSATAFPFTGSTELFAKEFIDHTEGVQEQLSYSFTEEATSASNQLTIDGKTSTELYPDESFILYADMAMSSSLYKAPVEALIKKLDKAVGQYIPYSTVNGINTITGTIVYEITSTHALKDTPIFTLSSTENCILLINPSVQSSNGMKKFTVTLQVDWGKLFSTRFDAVGSNRRNTTMLFNSENGFPDLEISLQSKDLNFANNPDVPSTPQFTGKMISCTMEASSISVTYEAEKKETNPSQKPGTTTTEQKSNTEQLDTTLSLPAQSTAKTDIVWTKTKPNPNKPGKPQPPVTPTIPTGPQTVMRLYNPNTGEHLFTTSEAERINLASLGWNVEGNDWSVPATSDYPIYRVYNPNNGDHHYTTSADEVSALVSYGWISEGTKLYSLTAEDDDNIAIYRMYNPNANGAGSHHYTSSEAECAALQAKGWNFEGLAWYGLKQ